MLLAPFDGTVVDIVASLHLANGTVSTGCLSNAGAFYHNLYYRQAVLVHIFVDILVYFYLPLDCLVLGLRILSHTA